MFNTDKQTAEHADGPVLQYHNFFPLQQSWYESEQKHAISVDIPTKQDNSMEFSQKVGVQVNMLTCFHISS